jgi:hypothetical protein
MPIVLELSEDIQTPSPSSTLSDKADAIQRHQREKYLEELPDRIETITTLDGSGDTETAFSSGDDVTVEFEATFDLGDTVVIELLDLKYNVLDSSSVSSTTGSVTFNNVSSSAQILQAHVENSGNYRVSEFREAPITIDGGIVHPDAPSYTELDSDFDGRFKTLSQRRFQTDELGLISNYIQDYYIDELLDNQIRLGERHVDLIAGLSFEAIEDQELFNGLQDGISRFFPDPGTSGQYPIDPIKDPGFEGNFDTTANTIGNYSSPNGSRGPGDQSEKQDLQNVQATYSQTESPMYPTSVFDETRQEDVSYDSDSDVQARIDEIDAIIDGGTLQGSSSTQGFNTGSIQDNYIAIYQYYTLDSSRDYGVGYASEKTTILDERLSSEVSNTDEVSEDTDYGVGI